MAVESKKLLEDVWKVKKSLSNDILSVDKKATALIEPSLAYQAVPSCKGYSGDRPLPVSGAKRMDAIAIHSTAVKSCCSIPTLSGVNRLAWGGSTFYF